jgi:hypothetical protein
MAVTIHQDLGGFIAAPGFYCMAEDRYHADPCETPSASSSVLKLIDEKTPKHAWAAHPRLNPDKDARETEALKFGSAAHMAVFEPDRFSMTYVIKPKNMTFSTTEGKAWRAEVEAAGLLILKEDDAITIQRMAKELGGHPEARPLLANCEPEVSGIWKDEETGLWCRARFDKLPLRPGKFIPDLKTMADLSTIERDAWKYRWHMQAAFYLDGYRAITGEDAPGFVMVAQEKSAPFCVAVRPWDAHAIEWGRAQIRRALRTLAGCLESGDWPGPPMETLHLPHYAEKDLESRFERGDFPDAWRAPKADASTHEDYRI